MALFAERQRTVDMADEDELEGKANSSTPGRIRSVSTARKEGRGIVGRVRRVDIEVGVTYSSRLR